MKHILRRPILSFTLMVLVLYAVYATIPADIKHHADIALVFTLSISFTWALVLMVTRTRIWTERGLGLLGTVSGDALLYLAIGLGTAFGLRAQLVDLARACLTVGVVLLLIGLLRTTHGDDIVENNEESSPPGSGTDSK